MSVGQPARRFALSERPRYSEPRKNMILLALGIEFADRVTLDCWTLSFSFAIV